MNQINFKFILTFILPKLLQATLLSAVVGLIVGGIVGLIVGAIAKRKKDTIIPSIIGSCIGTMLLGMMPIFASPESYIGGAYAGIGILVKMVTLIPAGSILGGVVGGICGLKLASRFQSRFTIIGLIVTYSIMVISLYINLAPTSFQFVKSTGQERDILPTIGKIIGYKQKFSTFYGGIRCLAFTRDGKKLIIANSTIMRVWEIDTGKLLQTFPVPPDGSRILDEVIDAIAISPDNKTFITAAPEQIQVRELATGKILTRLEGSSYVKLTPDGKRLIGFQRTDKPELNVGVWELSSGKLLYTIPSQIENYTSYTPFDITPDGKTLVIAPTKYNNEIELWQLDTGKKLESFGGNTPNPVTTLAVTPEGKTLITAQNANLQIWDMQTKKVVKTIPDVKEVKNLLISPDSQILISNGKSLDVWQLSTGKKLVTRQNQKEFLFTKLALSPDGKTLAASDEEGVRLWKLALLAGDRG